MLDRYTKLTDFEVFTEEEKLGEIHDIYFEDGDWQVRYAIIESGDWLLGERVIIAMEALGKPNWEDKRIVADVSREDIESRPKIDFAKPVSRERLSELHQHYQWAPIMPSSAPPGSPIVGPYPILPPTADISERRKLLDQAEEGEGSLRSAQEVAGYEVECENDCIGSVEDFFIEEDGWIIRYLLIDIRRWIKERRVIVSPEWVSEIDWLGEEIEVDLTKNQIENSPEFDPSEAPTRKYETALYDFYHQPGYWL